jgi:hypothetical protein
MTPSELSDFSRQAAGKSGEEDRLSKLLFANR